MNYKKKTKRQMIPSLCENNTIFSSKCIKQKLKSICVVYVYFSRVFVDVCVVCVFLSCVCVCRVYMFIMRVLKERNTRHFLDFFFIYKYTRI